MATVPGVLLIGEYHLTGAGPLAPSTWIDGFGATRLDQLNDRKLLRVTPDDPVTGNPSAATLNWYPWYDPNYGPTLYFVASSTVTSITVSPSPGWTVNEWQSRVITLLNTAPIAGVGFQKRLICTANTADTLTFATVAPDPAPLVGQAFRVGLGRFRDYHPAAGFLHISEIGVPSSRSGSNAYGPSGCGPDATLIRYLLEKVWTASPYFYLCKYILGGGLVGNFGDAPNNAQRAAVQAEVARMNAAAAAQSNTIAWDTVVVDLSAWDLQASGATPSIITSYATQLPQMIAWLRTTLGNANLRVVLVNHRSDLWGTTSPGGAPIYRAMHEAVAASDGNIGIVDMQSARVSWDGGATPGTEAKHYAQDDYFDMGEKIGETIRSLQLGIPATPDNGMPIYLMLGDSIFVGEANALFTTNNDSVSISGPSAPASLQRPANQKLWNRQLQTVAVYEPHSNSNTSGSVSASAGPDLSIMAELGQLHPDGFILVKRASNSSSLAQQLAAYVSGGGGRWIKSANQHYTELLADFAGAVQYCNQILGRQADVRGAFVCLGTNDQQVAGGGAAFSAAIAQFCRDLWGDFGTRSSGRNFPIVWRRPQVDIPGAGASELAAVRAAVEAQADAERQFVFVDADDLERAIGDSFHEAPESALKVGRRFVAALQTRAI